MTDKEMLKKVFKDFISGEGHDYFMIECLVSEINEFRGMLFIFDENGNLIGFN